LCNGLGYLAEYGTLKALHLNFEAFMRRLTLWMLLLSGLSTAVFAETAPTPASAPVITAPVKDIRQSGFVYCVNGMINTFNPQKASSGLIIDTLAAQL